MLITREIIFQQHLHFKYFCFTHKQQFLSLLEMSCTYVYAVTPVISCTYAEDMDKSESLYNRGKIDVVRKK